MGQITVAATQMACFRDQEENLPVAEALVREAEGQGARVKHCIDLAAKDLGMI